MFLAVALSVCASVAVFGPGGHEPSAQDGRGLPAGISRLALQARVSASDDPLLVRVPSTRALRWASALALGLLLFLAAAQRVAVREHGRPRQRTSAASALSRAPPHAIATLS